MNALTSIASTTTLQRCCLRKTTTQFPKNAFVRGGARKVFTTTVSSSKSVVAASKTLEEEYVQHADLYDGSKQTQLFSGLQGRALNAKEKEFPSMAQVLAKIPKECFEKDTGKSLMYAGVSTAITLAVGGVGDVAVYHVLFAGVDRVRVRGWDCGDWVLGCRARVRTRCVFG
jgi:hypothetical protein